MDEIFARLWQNITARLTGPMNLRLIIQPTVATILAIRAGLRDAHQDRPAFLWAVLWNPAHRRELLQQGWKDVGKVFLLAAILDVIYQLIIHRGVYSLELLITAVTLAIVPYVLLRGPISRIAKNGVRRQICHETSTDPMSRLLPVSFQALVSIKLLAHVVKNQLTARRTASPETTPQPARVDAHGRHMDHGCEILFPTNKR
jgi:hypothetical protein